MALPTRKPSSTAARSIPVIPIYRIHQRKAEIDGILTEHAYGLFRRAAMLVDEVMTDDRISGVVETRIGALMSAELEIRPARDKRLERKLAQQLGGIDDAKGIWNSMVPPATLFDLLKWGMMLGIAVAQVTWTATDGEWIPRLIPWHPQYLRWDWNLRRFCLLQLNGPEIVLPDLNEQPNGDPNWFIWAPRGLQLGWLNGMIRSLANAYLGRQWNFRDWSRSNEKYGLGIVKADVPQWADDQDREEFFASLSNIGNEAAVACPVGTKDNGRFDVSIVDSTARAWETFQTYKQSLDTDIAIRVLGQNLTTEVPKGGGSKAATQTHDLVRIDKAIEDAQIGDALGEQLLSWWTFFKTGSRDLTPSVIYHVEPATDENSEATALKTLGDAVQSLELAEPRIDSIAIMEAHGVPLMSEEEYAAQKAMELEEAAGRMQAVGGDGGDGNPDGGGGDAGGAGGPPPAAASKKDGRASVRAAAALSATVGRRLFAGLSVVVEYPTGSIRIHGAPGGDQIPVKMQNDYGYLDGFTGTDGEDLDCYLGPMEDAPEVHVIRQLRAPDFRAHDEDKVMLGFASADHAKAAYLAHRRDERAYGGMAVMPLDTFKAKLRRRAPDTATKIHASASASRSTTALMALANKVSSSRGRRNVAGPKRKALYQDRLQRRGQELAARALGPDLAAIMSEIHKATSLDDARRRVLARYRGLKPPAQLAEIVRKTNILGHLSGRFDAATEV